MALEIDQDIEAVVDDALGGAQRIEAGELDEMLGIAGQFAPIGAAVIGAVRVEKNVKPRPVMAGEEAGCQMRRGVVPDIGGQIAEADAPGPLALLTLAVCPGPS